MLLGHTREPGVRHGALQRGLLVVSLALLVPSPLHLRANANADERLEPFPTPFTERLRPPDHSFDGLALTYHSIPFRSSRLDYAAVCGRLRVTDSERKTSADVFFTAYSRKSPRDEWKSRPVVFAFNGGPGAASLWLHFALGPKRVILTSTGRSAAPPYALANNQYTILEYADIVFVDAVGTGYSRPNVQAGPKSFYGMQQDIDWTAAFVERFVNRFNLWASPKFALGESYGAMRSIWLATELQQKHGIDLRGLLLVSLPMDFRALFFYPGDDIPYVQHLPSYAAVAMYHGKTARKLRADPQKTLREVEKFATTDYLLALGKGDTLTAAERDAIATRLSAYTGLRKPFILGHNLRVTNKQFIEELLVDEGLTIGWQDGRFTSPSKYEFPWGDPSMLESTGPHVETWNEYVRNELRYPDADQYRFHSVEINRMWDWGQMDKGPITMYRHLRDAMSRNPHLRIMIASGYHDLNTPYFATRYAVNHANLHPSRRANIKFHEYPGGHQMYLHLPTLEKLCGDMKKFIRGSQGVTARPALITR